MTTVNTALMAEVEKLENNFIEKYLCEVNSDGYETSVKFIKVDIMSTPLENISVENSNKALAVATHQAILIVYDHEGDIVKLDRIGRPTVAKVYPSKTRTVSRELFEVIYKSRNLDESYEYLKLVLGL